MLEEIADPAAVRVLESLGKGLPESSPLKPWQRCDDCVNRSGGLTGADFVATIC